MDWSSCYQPGIGGPAAAGSSPAFGARLPSCGEPAALAAPGVAASPVRPPTCCTAGGVPGKLTVLTVPAAWPLAAAPVCTTAAAEDLVETELQQQLSGAQCSAELRTGGHIAAPGAAIAGHHQ